MIVFGHKYQQMVKIFNLYLNLLQSEEIKGKDRDKDINEQRKRERRRKENEAAYSWLPATAATTALTSMHSFEWPPAAPWASCSVSLSPPLSPSLSSPLSLISGLLPIFLSFFFLSSSAHVSLYLCLFPLFLFQLKKIRVWIENYRILIFTICWYLCPNTIII